MVDGDTETYAYSGIDDDVQLLTSNTCPGTDLGAITKVEIRVLGMRANFIGTADANFWAVFDGGDGDTHDCAFSSSSLTWTDYFDITEDTNAPETWTWNDVVNLDVDLEADIAGWAYCDVAKVEIRVTYETHSSSFSSSSSSSSSSSATP